jgi:cytochrome P450
LSDFNAEFFEPSWRLRGEQVDRFNAGQLAREELPLDLLTMIHLHRDETWDDDLPLRESAVFLVGATQTTSQAFAPFVINFEGWLDEHPEDRALISSDPEFLRRATGESLRLFVAAPARIRRATTDVVLGSGRRVCEGERIALLFLPANKGEEHFGVQADEYDPHRRPVNASQWGLAFGAGAHACIGRPLVTGIGSQSRSDGTMVTIARRLYAAGLELDPDRPPRFDENTYYTTYASVPVRFSGI